ncbi:Cell division protein FtsK [Minicystis rosea]|nr:Cell division protein FtsK [Minicystis rosea]
MPPIQRLLALSLTTALAASCTCSGGGPSGVDAGSDAAPVETSQAPPIDSAPAPAPPPPGVATDAPSAAAPLVPVVACPRGMLRIPGGDPPRGTSPAEPTRVRPFCIDRWEASLVDKATGMSISPYYPPDRRSAVQIATTWEKQRLEIGSETARQIALPALPEWQRKRDVEPVAVSRAGVVPNGYLSGIVAARACENAGKRLCRHDEWVLACEGEKQQRYPYGVEYRQGACNIFRALHPAAELHDNPSIGHHDPRLNLVQEASGDPLLRRTGATLTCRSTWGDDALWDMNGNLDEWVEDDRGRFDGGFFSRSKRDGCESTVTAHKKDYYDYSTGMRCCSNAE